MRVPGEVGSECRAVLPAGTWWLELATRESGRTEIGPLHVVGDQPIDLGAVELEPLGELALPAPGAPGASLTVHHLRADVESCVARISADDPEDARPDRLSLRPGRYRVTRIDAEGAAASVEVVVAAGQTALVEL
jgi:hypothetical protein